MIQEVRMFTSSGDTSVYTYDPEIANMGEVNEVIHQLERQTAGKAFSLQTGERVEHITRDTRDVYIVQPIAGG
jgi:hypothetical protein